MDSNITIQQSATLRGFCEIIVAKYSTNWPPSEDVIAGEIVLFAEPDGCDLAKLESLCAQLGVNVAVRELPEGLRGYNHSFRETREILIARVNNPIAPFGTQEHTLLHELRELIEYELRKIGNSVAVSDLESCAETFAITVRFGASIKAWKLLFDDVGDIESRWGRVALLLLVIVIGIVQAFSCVMLPHWEDRLENPRPRQRKLKHRS